jgi:aspartate kinase
MYGVSKITTQPEQVLVTFPQISSGAAAAAACLSTFAAKGVVVDMICQSAAHGDQMDFSFTTASSYLPVLGKVILAVGAKRPPMISSGYSKVNLYGQEMVTECGVAARALAALAKAEIDVVLITTSDLDISVLVHQQDEDNALQVLRTAFSIEA